MDEKDLLGRIHALVEEEHQLREGSDHTDEPAAEPWAKRDALAAGRPCCWPRPAAIWRSCGIRPGRCR